MDFLNLGSTPPKFNETHIVLILKIKNPKRVTGYLLISLCNVVCKLDPKVIANKLRKILPSIISDTQSAFVHGRLIADNVLVAFKTMHHISQKKGVSKGEMGLKLDMGKAYDRVEWGCLDRIMEKLGFHLRWLILQHISSIPYSMRINWKPYGCISLSRGLRQGDSLSPYIFLLRAEDLSSLIK